MADRPRWLPPHWQPLRRAQRRLPPHLAHRAGHATKSRAGGATGAAHAWVLFDQITSGAPTRGGQELHTVHAHAHSLPDLHQVAPHHLRQRQRQWRAARSAAGGQRQRRAAGAVGGKGTQAPGLPARRPSLPGPGRGCAGGGLQQEPVAQCSACPPSPPHTHLDLLEVAAHLVVQLRKPVGHPAGRAANRGVPKLAHMCRQQHCSHVWWRNLAAASAVTVGTVSRQRGTAQHSSEPPQTHQNLKVTPHLVSLFTFRAFRTPCRAQPTSMPIQAVFRGFIRSIDDWPVHPPDVQWHATIQDNQALRGTTALPACSPVQCACGPRAQNHRRPQCAASSPASAAAPPPECTPRPRYGTVQTSRPG